MGWRTTLLALALTLLAPLAGLAQDLKPVPPLAARVTDQTGTLTAAQRQALEDKLATFEREAGPQIAILMVPSTAPEDITDYTQRVADAWKIGRREVGDGVLVVVAKNDRAVRIAPAKALEGAIPDLAARQIIDRALVPAFRAGDFAGGLNAALDQLFARIRGEHLPAPAQGRAAAPRDTGMDWGALMMFFFVGVPIAGAVLTGLFGRKLGSLVTAGGAGALAWVLSTSLVLGAIAGVVALMLVGVMGAGGRGRRGGFGGPPVIWGGGGWGGGGGSWGGGGDGGFSSGGGGDFGGGGASGRW